MSLDLAPGIYHGALIEVVPTDGAGLVGDHVIGATVLNVASGGFSVVGKCSVLGDVYTYTRENDALSITPALIVAAEDGTPVTPLTPDGEPETQKRAVFDLDMIGEEDETGQEDPNLPHAVIPGEWAGYYPIGTYPAGTFIDVEDTTYGYRVKGRPHDAPVLDGASVDASTLDTSTMPPVPATDGDAPDNATTVTPIGGIGSMFYRWTEVTNADPVTYRLHVRAGSAPTTDGTYEVAAGVGLTSAAVRKLKDGTAIVGDGTVTYHAVVTVEDADGPGPASADVTGVPAQVTTADIAVGAITANLLTANDAFIDALDATDITGQTITGGMYRTAASGTRVEVGPGETFTFPSNEARFYTGSSQETDPARVIALAVNPGTTSEFGQLRLEAPEWTAASGSTTPSIINMNSRTHDGTTVGRILLSASDIRLAAADVDINLDASAGNINLTPSVTGEVSILFGTLRATMGTGSVGTGTFRTSVDARVSAVAPTVTMTTGGVGTGAFRDSVRSAVIGDYAAGAWTAYTPTFTASVTNPTLGNFTISGRYTQRGKTVTFVALITCDTAANMGSGNYQFGLPVAARATNEIVCIAQQSGPNHGYQGRGASTTTINLFLTSTDAVATVTSTGMIAGTSIRISGSYEAA